MIKFIQLSFFTLLTFSLSAQIVITEISYNPPESNTDSLEYIEMYNAGTDTLDISGYYFSDGITDTVEAGVVIPPMSYYVFSVNARAMQIVFGIESDEWMDGALRNGGETIAFNDPTGAIADMVDFADDDPWPSSADGTDGEGASIVLCDLQVDNDDGSNWRASTNNLNISLNGRDIFGSPGEENVTVCETVPDATVTSLGDNTFDPADITINVGETVQWVNVSGFHNVNGSKATYPDNPEGFSNGNASADNWTFEHTFTIPGHYDYQCDPHAGLGMVGTVTVIDPNMNTEDYPAYAISTVSSLDADGIADSLGVDCTLTGIVHSPNFRLSNNGLIFTIIDDANDGIGVFSNSDNLGYIVNEGDEVEIEGTISQFRGLTQIDAVSVAVIGTKDLFEPTLVSALDESTESQLIQIENLSYVDVSQWNPQGSGFNVNVTDGTTSYTVRIDNDIETFQEQGPISCTGGTLSIVGIGGQFVNPDEPPYDSGYQIFPRYNSDFLCTSSIEELNDAELIIYPNPVENIIQVSTDLNLERLMIMDMNGRILRSGLYSNRIRVGNLSSGQYTLLFEVDNVWKSKRFIKK